MTRNPALRTQRGFTLIEALFSAIVLAIGLLALAGFHAVALKDGTLVKARMMAANLAQEKLEDLKGFSRLQDDPSTTSVDECASAPCYTAIADNAGGKQSGGSLFLPATTVTVSGTAYTRSWTATCYTASAGATPSVTTDCANADYKLANVTIKWTDNQGAAQSVNLESVIYGIDPANAGRATANPVPTAAPSLTYTGDTSGPSLASGEGTLRSSNPLPTVSSKGYSVSTSFETVIYDNSGKIVSRQENETVNCVCEFASGSSAAYPASYFYWNGSSVSIKTPSATVSKAYGTVPSIQGDTQNELCGVCCRDHHDSEAPSATNPTTALYDPDRASYDYTSGGDHKHYYYSTDTSGTTACTSATNCTKTNPLAAVSSGYYLESCRMARVDGIWRTMQDWRLKDVVVMPKTYLDTSSNQSMYGTYNSDYLRYVAYSDCVSAGGTSCSSISQTTKPSKPTGRNVSIQKNEYNQLLAYGLYVDRVYKTTAPRTLDAGYYTTLKDKIVAYQSDSSQLGWRDIMSFNLPNVTLLASWYSSTQSSPYDYYSTDASANVSVKNDTIKNIDSSTADYYGVYYRGLVTGMSTSGTAYVYAYMLPSNSGLNGGVTREVYTGVYDYYPTTSSITPWQAMAIPSEIGTDPLDTVFYDTKWVTSSTTRKFDKIAVVNKVLDKSVTVSGLLTSGNSSANPSVTVTAVSSTGASTSCTVSTTGSTGTFNGTFSCAVGSDWSGTITITSSATGAFFDTSTSTTDTTYDFEMLDGYSSSFTASTTSSSDTSHQFWIFGPTINVTGTLYSSGQAGSQVSCTDSSSTTCTVSNGSSITAGSVTLDSTTHTWTGTVTLKNQTGKSNKIATPATSATDCNSATTSAKTTSSMTVGPTDGVGTFTFCAK